MSTEINNHNNLLDIMTLTKHTMHVTHIKLTHGYVQTIHHQPQDQLINLIHDFNSLKDLDIHTCIH